MQNRRWTAHLAIILAGMAALNLLVFWKFRDRVSKGYGDFAVLYTAGRILTEGQGQRLYDADLQFQEQQEFAPQVEGRHAPLPYNHPPFEGLLFVSLARLPYFAAFCVWTAFNAAIVLTLPWLLRPDVGWLRKGSAGFWLLGALAYFPLGLAFLQGQDTVLLLLLLALVYRALRRNAEFAAGCWLAIGLFRPQIVLPLLLLLALSRRWRLIGGFATVAAGLALISVGTVGWHTALYYPEFVWHAEHGLVDPMSTLRMPNLHGLLVTIGAGLGLQAAWINALTAGASIALIGVVARISRGKENSAFDLEFSLAIVAAVLISYHAYVYDLTFLLLPMTLVIDFVLRTKKPAVGLTMALVLPVGLLLFSPLHFLLAVFQTKTSLTALVLLVWAGALVWQLKRIDEGIPASIG